MDAFYRTSHCTKSAVPYKAAKTLDARYPKWTSILNSVSKRELTLRRPLASADRTQSTRKNINIEKYNNKNTSK